MTLKILDLRILGIKNNGRLFFVCDREQERHLAIIAVLLVML